MGFAYRDRDVLAPGSLPSYVISSARATSTSTSAIKRTLPIDNKKDFALSLLPYILRSYRKAAVRMLGSYWVAILMLSAAGVPQTSDSLNLFKRK